MVRAALPRQFVVDGHRALTLEKLLQGRLVVQAPAADDRLGAGEDETENKGLRTLHAAVQVNRRDQRLRHIRENAGALPVPGDLGPAAKAHAFAQAELPRRAAQALLADQLRPDAGHLPLGEKRAAVVKELRRRKAENGVAQEFQALVAAGMGKPVLIGVGAVGHGRLQKRQVLKMIFNSVLQFRHGHDGVIPQSPRRRMLSMFKTMSSMIPDSANCFAWRIAAKKLVSLEEPWDATILRRTSST